MPFSFVILESMKDLNRIKEVLVSKKVTQVWLASEIGKNINTVSAWSTNRRQPSLEDLYRISVLLDVDIRELLNPTK
ncbi:MAG: helix-turn-helix transcriptional regulator [Flavobacterium sp.]|uniref:helix-turn-helix transcriptional regulator n=1 Tax=Flavobacterium sp. TaxID=239 RepID=UPI0025C64D46|nr:helix-turn-helix transcriptional regulator [Flavobacterium sp.]MCK6609247.1 helix-turn-helix transcriptional regulator [Flavobacterium sp.]